MGKLILSTNRILTSAHLCGYSFDALKVDYEVQPSIYAVIKTKVKPFKDEREIFILLRRIWYITSSTSFPLLPLMSSNFFRGITNFFNYVNNSNYG